jgi:hypothetical protein
VDLLLQPAERNRFIAVLKGFYGFHRVWEDAVARWPEIRVFNHSRTCLPHLRRDLAGLRAALVLSPQDRTVQRRLKEAGCPPQ